MQKGISKTQILVFLLVLFSTLALFILQNVLSSQIILNSVRRMSSIYNNQSFDPNKHVLVFLHVQKTGGSDFDRAMVKHLQLRKSGKYVKACLKSKPIEAVTTHQTNTRFKPQKFKKYQCVREKSLENWYFSRQTFGWVCGLHPDITDLTNCVYGFYPDAKPHDFHFFTILRDPFLR